MEKTPIIINQPTMLVQEEPRGPSMLIEVLLDAAQLGLSSVTLPIVQELQSDMTQTTIIKGIRLVTVGELSNGPISGFVNAPLTELVKISLLLYAEGWTKGFNIPILSLNSTFTEASGIPYIKRTNKFMNWQDVMWNKSKLIYSNGTAVVGTPYCVLIEVEYVRFDANGLELRGPQN
jgi:hypothetical protein